MKRLPLNQAALLAAVVTMLLPLLALVPLGGFYLWDRGWLLAWLIIAATLGASSYGIAAWLATRAERREAVSGPVSGPNPDFAPLDLRAWESVQKLAKEVDAGIVLDRDLLLDTARETIERVAAHYHPDARHPVWNFTLPEALLLTERVSVRLRRVLLQQVPGAHVIRAGQLMRLWEFKPLASHGARVFHGVQMAWRLIRLVNPANAILAEARERLFAAALGDAGSQLKQRGARIWVEEVGRAAIELYSGRLHLDSAALADVAANEPLAAGVVEPELPGPLKLVIAGQTNAGKSSLVNALLDETVAGVDALPHTAEFTAHALHQDGLHAATLIDAPGLTAESDIPALTELVWNSDGLLWVVAAHRADRALDRAALDAIRKRFIDEPRRRLPPIRVVVSHVDRLSPAREWSPPYDLDKADRPKAASIRAALDAIAEDLATTPEQLTPVRLQGEQDRYNVDLLWLQLAEDFDHARRGRVLRLALGARTGSWRQWLGQARHAGRTLLKEMTG